MNNKIGANMLAAAAEAAMLMSSWHHGVPRQYASGCTPGEPGHGRPSVNRPKKNKSFGKNKKKRK